MTNQIQDPDHTYSVINWIVVHKGECAPAYIAAYAIKHDVDIFGICQLMSFNPEFRRKIKMAHKAQQAKKK